MIKPFDQWLEENPEEIVCKNAYIAGVETTKAHYENEAIAIMEYYDMILRKTSTAKLSDAPPPPQSESEKKVVRKLLAGDYK